MNNSTFAAAAAHGLPIISTRGKTLERFFLHGENVFLCPPRDPEAPAATIQTVTDRAELRGHLASGALKLAGEWFSWDGRWSERWPRSILADEDPSRHPPLRGYRATWK
jgi:glycosyltransferase involved in cell wall biosynthesis